jgi:hypothetical protein
VTEVLKASEPPRVDELISTRAMHAEELAGSGGED